MQVCVGLEDICRLPWRPGAHKDSSDSGAETARIDRRIRCSDF